MDDPVPMNDLDRAIHAMRRSRAAIPEFYRQLATGDLWFLIPFHPEVEDQSIQITNGSPLPFYFHPDAQGEKVLLFSSEARVEESLKNGRVPPRTFSTGSMPAGQILEILGKTGLHASINMSCATGEAIVPPDLMCALADGSALL
jgi:SseB protein N-terminal domain